MYYLPLSLLICLGNQLKETTDIYYTYFNYDDLLPPIYMTLHFLSELQCTEIMLIIEPNNDWPSLIVIWMSWHSKLNGNYISNLKRSTKLVKTMFWPMSPNRSWQTLHIIVLYLQTSNKTEVCMMFSRKYIQDKIYQQHKISKNHFIKLNGSIREK